MSGGRLVLTDKALIFCPMDLSEAKKMAELVFTVGQVPGGDVISKLAALGGDSAQVLPLANIASVEQTASASLFKPPSARVTTKVGSVYDFGVLAGPGYPSGSKKNNDAVADFVAKARPLLSA